MTVDCRFKKKSVSVVAGVTSSPHGLSCGSPTPANQLLFIVVVVPLAFTHKRLGFPGMLADGHLTG